MSIIDILNFQPFGEYGVNSLLSVRVFHIALFTIVALLIRATYKDGKKGGCRKC